ncbi:MAG: DUF4259 domain-containing protein [Opitutaceae bacterium]
MGAWGLDSFENDDALDWVQNELEPLGEEAIDSAISAVLVEGYLDAPECSSAVAACEVLAVWQGRPSNGIPADIRALAEGFSGRPSKELREKARRALVSIVEDSELQGLIAEGDGPEYEQWKKAMAHACLIKIGRKIGKALAWKK